MALLPAPPSIHRRSTPAIHLHEGSQHDFVTSSHRHSAYLGGIGSGKTFALIVRGLMMAQKAKAAGLQPPRGCFLTVSFPSLKDIVYPQLYKVFDMLGWKENREWREVKNQTDRKFILLHNGGEILMRSLDQPDRIRGIEVSWFGIDEGRNFDSDYAYRIMTGRLRQAGYSNHGMVCSTPNGFDWMYYRFHPKGNKQLKDSEWYSAAMLDNLEFVGEDYIQDLRDTYHGRFFEQEVEGKFVGVVEGSIFSNFDPEKHANKELGFNPDLPLYSFWDFGIGDQGVCLFAQVEWRPYERVRDGLAVTEYQPVLRVIGHVEMKDATIAQWADAYWRYCEKHFVDAEGEVRYPLMSWGDPAGLQRNVVTGTSSYDALTTHGINVIPAPKRPKDEAIIIVQNLIEGDRLLVSSTQERVIQAIGTYRWKVDDEGNRLGEKPVHDWTSHFCDAIQYGANGLIGLLPRRRTKPTEEAARGTIGYIHDQIFNKDEEVAMGGDQTPDTVDWHADFVIKEGA